MLKIKLIRQFKKDLKNFKYNRSLLIELNKVLKQLLQQQRLDPKYLDHALSGKWNNSRECHVQPDILLIYRIEEESSLLILERFGSHAELFE